MNWTEEQIEEAWRIVFAATKKMSEKRETPCVSALLQHILDSGRDLDERSAPAEWVRLAKVLESRFLGAMVIVGQLQERNTRDVAGLIERLQVKTEREGFVNLAILPEGLRAEVEKAAEVWRTEAQARRLAWQREVLGQ